MGIPKLTVPKKKALIIRKNDSAVLQWSHPLALAACKSWGIPINYNCIGRKSSIHNSNIEFSGNLYLIEGARGSDKRDAGGGDLIENWDVRYPMASAISCGSGSSGIGESLIILYQKKIVVLFSGLRAEVILYKPNRRSIPVYPLP